MKAFSTLVGVASLMIASTASAQTAPTEPPSGAASEAAAPAEPPAAPVAAPPPPMALPPVVLRTEPPPERWVALVLGLGSVVAGGVFGVVALNDQSTFNTTPTRSNADATARDGLLADAFLGVGILAIATAVVLFVIPGTNGASDATTGGHAVGRAHFTGSGFAVSF